MVELKENRSHTHKSHPKWKTSVKAGIYRIVLFFVCSLKMVNPRDTAGERIIITIIITIIIIIMMMIIIIIIIIMVMMIMIITTRTTIKNNNE